MDDIQTYKITDEEAAFPEALKRIAACPTELFVKGELPDILRPSVAIVGARMCSEYGKAQAYRFGAQLAAHGVQIISGLAKGVDAFAHEGALSVSGGRTFGILGCGIDLVYPVQNRYLYDKVMRRGGLISEYKPGTPPLGFHFPMRNRIIAGFADLVLVIEARERSGSLITVDYALEQGKAVYALPGRVDEAMSAGCNRLISQGAGIACSPDDLLKELQIEKNRHEKEGNKINFGLATNLELVYSCLDFSPKSLQAIQEETGIPALKLRGQLLELELLGCVREIMKDFFVKTGEF